MQPRLETRAMKTDAQRVVIKPRRIKIRISAYICVHLRLRFLGPQFLMSRSAGRTTLVIRRLPFRTPLPALVHPKPLGRIAPHVNFDNFREQLSVGRNVGFVIVAADQLHRRIKTKPVFVQRRVPGRKSRDHGGAGPQLSSARRAHFPGRLVRSAL